jgi:hypothetical protein
MSRLLIVTNACLLSVALATAAPAPKRDAMTPLDLQPKANQKLTENLHSDTYPNNNLAGLKTGKQNLEGIPFEIGEKLIQLGCKSLPEKPEKVEGIKVERTVAKLHFLHATGYRTEDDTVIGKYVAHYDDNTKEEIEIVYGKDVRDWWNYPCAPGVSRGKVIWKGENEASKGFNATLQLFLMTWENPHPRKKVTSIDFLSTQTEAAPFCVAITAEAK